MSLPAPWVDKLFQKLAVTYGQGFLRQYDGVPIEEVKANWAHELSCFQQSPDAIRYGLEYLPASKAPTVLEFRDLCRRAPAAPVPQLEAPEVDPEKVKAVTKALRGIGRKERENDLRAWAYRLKERDERGPGISAYQRSCYREALRIDQGELLQ